MSLLFSGEILNQIRTEVSRAQNDVQIISAYGKCAVIQEINSLIKPNVTNKRLMLRFRKDDIIKGSTDFSALEFALSHGWKVYIRFDLHAKTYIVDSKRCIIGSANATNQGLSLSRVGNMEMATLVELESTDIQKINKLFDEAVFVDKDVFLLLKSETAEKEGHSKSSDTQWSSQITDLFHPTISTLFTHELPDTSAIPQAGSINFLDISAECGTERIREAFRWSNAYLWLLNELSHNDGVLFFGEATQRLHNTLVQDPKPYRRDIKCYLSNLLSWIELLYMDEIIVDRPHHSQRIMLRKS